MTELPLWNLHTLEGKKKYFLSMELQHMVKVIL